MKKSSGNKEGIPRGYPYIVWKTRKCPHCEVELRLWFPSRGNGVKVFCCRYCRRLFHMDKFGVVQGDLYEVVDSNYGSVKVGREIEEVVTTE